LDPRTHGHRNQGPRKTGTSGNQEPEPGQQGETKQLGTRNQEPRHQELGNRETRDLELGLELGPGTWTLRAWTFRTFGTLEALTWDLGFPSLPRVSTCEALDFSGPSRPGPRGTPGPVSRSRTRLGTESTDNGARTL